MQLFMFVMLVIHLILRIFHRWCNAAAAALALLVLSISANGQTEIRVDAASTATTPDGSTWANAYKYLQDGIAEALANLPAEVWVADGTYYPDITAATAGAGGTNSRSATFKLNNNLKILGGFAGGATNETSKYERRPLVNICILSGDIQQNDPGTITDNSYHVVTGELVNTSAVIDGFTITAGNAHGASTIACTSPTCPPPGGSCTYGLSNWEVGGGMILLGIQSGDTCSACQPYVMRCKFVDNRADEGAGVFYSASQASNPIFGNCEFRDNIADGPGGGARTGSDSQLSHATFVNCVFAGNSASSGGALAVRSLSGAALYNCTIGDNQATAGGGAAGVLHEGSCPIPPVTREGWAYLANTIVYGSDSPQLVGATKCDHAWVKEFDEICDDNGGNLEGNPLFVGGGNYRLQSASGCIDTGSNAIAFATDPGDVNQDGSDGDMMVELDQRIRISGLLGATTCGIDRGAYERTSGGCVGDTAPSPGGNNAVDVDDLIAVILGWGACPTPPALCPGDVVGGTGGCGQGTVDVDDLIAVILNWGPCPGLVPGSGPAPDMPENYADCQELCMEYDGERWISCMQSCLWYLCNEKQIPEYCEE